jgi:hypothetical protein
VLSKLASQALSQKEGWLVIHIIPVYSYTGRMNWLLLKISVLA